MWTKVKTCMLSLLIYFFFVTTSFSTSNFSTPKPEIRSCLEDGEEFDTCLDTLISNDEELRNRLSEYFVRRSPYEMIFREYKKEQEVESRKWQQYLEEKCQVKFEEMKKFVQQVIQSVTKSNEDQLKEILELNQQMRNDTEEANELIREVRYPYGQWDYSAGARQTALNTTFSFRGSAMRTILCSPSGKFHVNFSEIGENIGFRSTWRSMVKGESDRLYFYLMFPHPVDGFVAYFQFRKDGQDIVFRAEYPTDYIHSSTSPELSIVYNLQLDIPNKNNNPPTIINKMYQNAEISWSDRVLLNISTVNWSSFSDDRLPILTLQLLSIH